MRKPLISLVLSGLFTGCAHQCLITASRQIDAHTVAVLVVLDQTVKLRPTLTGKGLHYAVLTGDAIAGYLSCSGKQISIQAYEDRGSKPGKAIHHAHASWSNPDPGATLELSLAAGAYRVIPGSVVFLQANCGNSLSADLHTTAQLRK